MPIKFKDKNETRKRAPRPYQYHTWLVKILLLAKHQNNLPTQAEEEATAGNTNNRGWSGSKDPTPKTTARGQKVLNCCGLPAAHRTEGRDFQKLASRVRTELGFAYAYSSRNGKRSHA